MNTKLLILLSVILMLASCRGGLKKKDAGDDNSVRQLEITELWRSDTSLMTPESVIYDRKRDLFYITNMNMEPRLKDGNGFISKMDKVGNINDLRWIEGLSSPKGMAITGDTLFAADVDELVIMDIIKGEIIEKIPIEGAMMLNDISSDSVGNLYISDTDANKIYKYSEGRITDWLTEGLNGPNGLLLDGNRLLVASQGSNDFASVDLATKSRTFLTEGITHGDGIAYTGIPGHFIVTDWNGEVFLINPDNSKRSLLKTSDKGINSADVEMVPELNLLLVPTFYRNCVVAYFLQYKKVAVEAAEEVTEGE